MKNILITGCSSGIGEFCALNLCKNPNFKVFATCRAENDVKRLQNLGLTCFKLDLNDSQSIKDGFSKMLELSGGKIDILFNNAAFGQPGAVEDLSDKALKEQFQSNVFGTQELTNLALKVMRAQNSGKIIYNSSILGFSAMAYRGAYNSSKFAIEALADTLRLELRNSGIKVVLIEPGPIRSKFRQNSLAKFLENINIENSFHKDYYQATLSRLEGSRDTPFTLNQDAVYKKLLKAINSKSPKARYFVTFPTYLFWYLKRVLPTKWFDFILFKAGG